MPLSPPVAREMLHQRDIALRGYRRSDGLFEVEAEIADTKTYPIATDDRGPIAPGEPLHLMRLRLTVDEGLTITAAEAATEAGPFLICAGGAASFARLTGLAIRPGFMREVAARIGGSAGCTHIRELVQQMATVAFQTLYAVRARRDGETAAGAARLIDTCYSYAADGPVVKRRWPDRYTGPDRAPVAADPGSPGQARGWSGAS